MPTIAQVSQAMQTVLTTVADTAARTTGLVQRASKLTGALFVQTLVFGFLAHPRSTRAQLATTAAALGVEITAQAIDQRLTEPAAHCLATVLDAAAATVLVADPVTIPLLTRFTGVYMQDSSTIGLPRTLAHLWVGSGNQHTQERGAAALKLGVRLNLTSGGLTGPHLDHGVTSDHRLVIQDTPIPAGALHMADLGFFDLTTLARISSAQGFWLTRLQASTTVCTPDGVKRDLLAWLAAEAEPTTVVDQPVRLGTRQQLPARLLAVRVPPHVVEQRRRRLHAEAKRRGRTASAHQLAWAAWTILVTNVPVERLTLPEALVLLRTRWQIELLFKLWKSHGQVDTWRSGRPMAILCEVYAKVIGMIIQHWFLLVSCWDLPDRSMTKAAATIRDHIVSLAGAFVHPLRLAEAMQAMVRCIRASCRINKRRTTPHTYQLLLDLSESVLG